MTDRLDRLEALAETTLLAIDQLRQRQEQTQLQIDQLRQRQEQAQQQIEQNRETALDAVQIALDLGEHVEEFRRSFQAHIERTDRILDYLVRRTE